MIRRLLMTATLAFATFLSPPAASAEDAGSAGEASLRSTNAPQAGQAAKETGNASRYELGAVMDVRRPHVDGITVLAITPGGAADRMHLRVGDRLLAVNGQRLDDGLKPSATLESALQDSGGELRIEAIRDGQPLTLSGRADATASPTAGDAGNMAGACGYVTTHGAPPKLGRRIFHASLAGIDGGGTPLPSNRHRLAAGPHVLIVREHIGADRFDPVQRQRRETTLRRLGPRAYKVLIVDIEPDTRYRIGAQLLEDRLDSDSIRANAYWKPVVWEEVADDCSRSF